jgi:GT2 family glycosyltransferase
MSKQSKQIVSVSIVIPNWNGVDLLAKNLPSVIAAAPKAEIIIADDASVDGSVAYVKQHYPGITVVGNTHQQGFAGNVNSGVRKATGEVVILLNTDVRPEKNFLAPLLKHFDDPMVAAVGCMEESHDPQGVVLRGRGVARWEKGYFIHSKGDTDKSDTAWVSGGSSAFRRNFWITLGGMDTIYNPFYWEDIDLSYQFLKSGYRIVFERQSVVGHFHEEGKIKTSYTPAQVKRIAYRNQYIFLWKNISDVRLWMTHCFWTPIRLVQAVFRGDILMLEGYMLAIVKLPSIWRSRARAKKYWKLNDMTTLPHTV